ncbi:hypothetical protein ACR78Z_24455 [Sphingobacterium thalpophilum]|uniref:hypothetical protein n=1 Tax=Sphingobacterium thalpophilum TaxID=259 RepID=UPI003DA1DEBF
MFKELEKELLLISTKETYRLLGGNSTGNGGYWSYVNGKWEYTFEGGTLEEVVVTGSSGSSGNWYGHYFGPNNPPTYQLPPIDNLDFSALIHDLGYDSQGSSGISGALFDTDVTANDLLLVMMAANTAMADPTSASYDDFKQRLTAAGTSVVFGAISILKIHKEAVESFFGIFGNTSGN